MRSNLCLAACLGSALWVGAQPPAYAAAAKSTFYACKEQAVFKKAFEVPAGKEAKDDKANRARLEAYFKDKIASGACLQLARGQQVSVDQRDKNLWCVRLSGGLDCYWTVDQAIDLNPSASTTTPGTQQPGRSRNH
jgi:hypothetical protein